MARKTERHFTVLINVVMVEKDVDDYTGKTTDRSTEQVINLTVRAATLNKAIEKANDHLWAEKEDEDEAKFQQDVSLQAALPEGVAQQH